MKHRILYVAMALMAIACGNKTNPEQPGGGSETPSTVAPKQPTGLKVLDGKTTETSLTFQWDPQSGVKFSYTLTQGSTTVKEGSTSNRNVKVDGLTKATTYQFTVFAVVGDSKSAGATLEAKTAGEDDPGVDPGVDPGTDPTIAYEEFGIPEAEEDGIARAFPGAEGGGMYTTGGRGGKIYHVTSLDDTNTQGTLRYGIEKGDRPLTIVFDVAGIIELKGDLRITKGDLTIAGQTAPGDGICLKNYATNISASNVIIRFMRFRLGDEAPWTATEISNGSADGEDCIWGRYNDNIVLDHCSMSWSVDECASFYGNEFFTMQWCLIAESMKNCKLHTKGNHGYGGLWGGKNASFHHNILAHHDSRNARIDHPHIYENHKNPSRRGNVDLRNNVIYDWGDNSTYGGEGGHFNLVNNYYKKGPSSKDRKYFVDAYSVYSKCSSCKESNIDEGYPELYLMGNVYSQYATMENGPAGIYWHNGGSHTHYNETLSAPLLIFGQGGKDAYTSTHSAENALDAVCSFAGASLVKDAVDVRISSHILSGGGKLIDDIAAVKTAYGEAWPVYKATEEQLNAKRDADADGIPNDIEEAWGLNKSDPKDASEYTLDPDKRYTNLEMYLHYLVKDIVNGGNQKAEYKKL